MRYTKMYIKQVKNKRIKELTQEYYEFTKLIEVLVMVITIPVEMKAPATACISAWTEAGQFFLDIH